jgi:hypothetical protein
MIDAEWVWVSLEGKTHVVLQLGDALTNRILSPEHLLMLEHKLRVAELRLH